MTRSKIERRFHLVHHRERWLAHERWLANDPPTDPTSLPPMLSAYLLELHVELLCTLINRIEQHVDS